MEQPHGPRDGDVGRAHHDAFAAHAAKRGKGVLRREAPAIDDEIRPLRRIAHAKLHADAGCLHFLEQESERRIRVQVGLAVKIESGAEAGTDIGLERGERGRVEALPALGHAREAVEQNAVARRRDDETAVGDGAGIGRPSTARCRASRARGRSPRRFPPRSAARAWRRRKGCTHPRTVRWSARSASPGGRGAPASALATARQCRRRGSRF